METLHVRAEHSVIEKILALLNRVSKEGQTVEILDDTAYTIEKEMIQTALLQESAGDVRDHESVWKELLKR